MMFSSRFKGMKRVLAFVLILDALCINQNKSVRMVLGDFENLQENGSGKRNKGESEGN